MAGRVAYLAKYYPDALHPTLKRKIRKRGWGRQKYRAPGGNRMSQDGAPRPLRGCDGRPHERRRLTLPRRAGKGGRSANS